MFLYLPTWWNSEFIFLLAENSLFAFDNLTSASDNYLVQAKRPGRIEADEYTLSSRDTCRPCALDSNERPGQVIRQYLSDDHVPT